MTDFKLPELGENIEEAEVAEIYVSEGDEISAEQNILELESEKASMDLPCPYSGQIEKIHVKKGDSVKVGQTLISLTEGAEAEAPAAKEEAPIAEEESAETAERSQPTQPEQSREPQPAAKKEDSAAAVRETSAEKGAAGKAPLPAGPATRRMARELGLSLSDVDGSGPGGRITGEDVARTYAAQQKGSAGRPMGTAEAPPLPDFSAYGPTKREPLGSIGKAAAKGYALSWSQVPHVTHHDLADVTDLEATRKRYNKSASEGAPKITMTAILIKAVVSVLKAMPKVNASLDPQTNELVFKQYYHIGCAVDTDRGLLVPVIRDADRKSVVQIAKDLAQLSEKARYGRLDMDAMQGGSFTVSNLGGIGGTGFTPIVNYPEVAILGVSRGKKEVQLDDDGRPVERLKIPLSLSYDHRVVNGADAARFVVKLQTVLSHPDKLLMET